MYPLNVIRVLLLDLPRTRPASEFHQMIPTESVIVTECSFRWHPGDRRRPFILPCWGRRNARDAPCYTGRNAPIARSDAGERLERKGRRVPCFSSCRGHERRSRPHAAHGSHRSGRLASSKGWTAASNCKHDAVQLARARPRSRSAERLVRRAGLDRVACPIVPARMAPMIAKTCCQRAVDQKGSKPPDGHGILECPMLASWPFSEADQRDLSLGRAAGGFGLA